MKAGEFGQILDRFLYWPERTYTEAADLLLIMCKLGFKGKEYLWSSVFHLHVPLTYGIFTNLSVFTFFFLNIFFSFLVYDWTMEMQITLLFL